MCLCLCLCSLNKKRERGRKVFAFGDGCSSIVSKFCPWPTDGVMPYRGSHGYGLDLIIMGLLQIAAKRL